ncbi:MULTISPECIES: toxin-antitoxin system YwqK family antitoxin [unclassified Tenacibaculum]|uniref:toxin-antitoxin system YwqK family antitoxin n=1 Tax=unclassified Tenacibaculum TaxID=2635139 RepID=UPI001F412525|nr:MULTISPECIES: hypothetical protein [unclassified Tenacibaculum]MCF2875037.1 hypothetical protein [Tenacibaculum sp. Cn5-1]MCF2935113.1 hypothetical protein [Tenacibaculum sp. Cn5-34]MCG7511445.1 hypothetical protein [Tenacibaculum sp. Cn5-46]
MKKLFFIWLCVSFFSCGENPEKIALKIQYPNNNIELKNGVLFYKGVPFSGTIISYNEVNKTNDSAQYLNGKKEGEELKKYLNGSLAEQRFYEKGLKSGIHKAWWENGNQKFIYHFNTKGEYNGNVKIWYKNGQLYKDFNYKEGKESGSQKMWQGDGKLRANFVTKNGERFGLIGLKKCYSVNVKDESFK